MFGGRFIRLSGLASAGGLGAHSWTMLLLPVSEISVPVRLCGMETSGHSPGPTSLVPGALTAAVALVAAALAALGLTGEALLRAVRNSPSVIALVVSLAVLGAATFALSSFWLAKSPKKEVRTKQSCMVFVFSFAGLLVMVAAVLTAVWVGAAAVAARELPQVTLGAGPSKSGPTGKGAAGPSSIEITVTAEAANMVTGNDLLIQVVGLIDDHVPDASEEPFVDPPFGITEDTIRTCEANHASPHGTGLSPTKGKVLLWNRLGPEGDGSVHANWSIQIPTGVYSHVCAWARVGGTSEASNSSAYLRLN